MTMRGNIQHSTFNIQRSRSPQRGCPLERWVLNIEYSMFLFLIFLVPSLSAQTNTNILPPLAPAYGEMPPTFWERYGTYVLVAGFIFITLIGIVCWLIFRPKSPAPVPPEVRARKTLMKLVREPETGTVLSEISQTLQHYIIAASGLPPGEWTTAEFCAALASSEKFGAELAQAASSFLRECDQRKFSPSGSAVALNAANRALEIVSEMEKQRAKFAVQK